MRKTLAILLAFAIINVCAVLLHGCCTPGRYCNDMIKGISLQALDNADSVAHEPTAKGILGAALLLRLNVDRYKACQNNSIGFITTAMAMHRKCDEPYGQARPDHVLIVSNNNYSARFPAGTNLKDLFKMSDDIQDANPGSDVIDMFSLYPPDDTGTHVFTITLRFGKLDSMVATTNPVKILK